MLREILDWYLINIDPSSLLSMMIFNLRFCNSTFLFVFSRSMQPWPMKQDAMSDDSSGSSSSSSRSSCSDAMPPVCCPDLDCSIVSNCTDRHTPLKQSTAVLHASCSSLGIPLSGSRNPGVSSALKMDLRLEREATLFAEEKRKKMMQNSGKEFEFQSMISHHWFR